MNRYTTRPDLLKMLQKYDAGTATEEEAAFVDQYYAFLGSRSVDGELPDAEAAAKMQRAMEAWLLDYILAAKAEKEIKLWPRVVWAAAAVATITLGVWLYKMSDKSHDTKVNTSASLANDVAPGKNGASLTLANGEVIQLSNAKSGLVIEEDKVTYHDGTALQGSRSASGQTSDPNRAQDDDRFKGMQMLTASTTKGQTYKFTLPDGTGVWLNADSKISFTSQFPGKERRILLSGEAYFEVAKNKQKPFIVVSAGQELRVLGTHFNVSAYQDEQNIKTTLLEGSINVNGTTVKPGQQSVLSADQRIAVKEVDVSEALDWKNGEFVFNKEDLRSVMRRVGRWYAIDVTFAEGVAEDISLSGYVSRTTKLSGVLELIERTGKAKIKIAGRKVTILPN